MAFYTEDLDEEEKESVVQSISLASESIKYSNSSTYNKVSAKRDSQITLLNKNIEKK